MRIIILTIIYIVLFLSAVSAETRDFHELGAKGYALVLDMQFYEANKIFDEMIQMEPENAIGHFLKSKNYFWMYVFSNNKEEYIDKFADLSFETINISKKMLAKNKNDIDALFYLGTAYLYLSRWYGEKGSWIKVIRYGRKGRNYLKEVTEKDPYYYDAYLGLGMYHYYVDVLPKFIKFLSFLFGGLEGDREKGIDEVTLASSKGNLTRGEAKFILAQAIYADIENDYEAAAELFEELTVTYPDNLCFKMQMAVCYRNLFKYDLSIEAIKKSLQMESLNEYPNLQTLFYRYLGNTYSAMNEYDKAVQAFKDALTLLESQKRTKSWEYAGALWYIGDCYEMIGAIDKAHAYYSRLTKEDEKNAYNFAQARLENPLTRAQIKLGKGANYLRYGKYSQADTIFHDLLQSESNKNPLNNTFIAELHYYLARLEYEYKDYQESIQTFQQVLSSNDIKQDWIKQWSHYYLGNCYRNIGEMEKATKEYHMAYKYEGNTRLRVLIDKARKKMKGN